MSPSSPPAPKASQSSPHKHVSRKRKRASEGQSTSKSFTAAEHAAFGGFLWRHFRLDIPLAPVHSGDLREGIEQVLDKWLSRYVPSLGFVLLGVDHDSLQCPKTAKLLPPGAMALAQGVSFRALGWRPTIGSKLRGRIMHSTRSNMSLIIHNTFNAVIESSQVPSDLFAWDSEKVNPIPPYEPLEDDFYKDMFQEDEQQEAAAQMDGATEGLEELALQKQVKQEEEPETVIGCWINKDTQEPVGDAEGMLEFTVIGLTVANSTVTVIGSLQAQPFANQAPSAPEAPQRQASLPPLPSDIDIDQPPAPSKSDKKKRKKQKE